MYAADQLAKFRLRSEPSKTSSPTYELPVAFFKKGTPEEFIKFKKQLKRVFHGQDLTTAAQKVSIVHRLLVGQALTNFKNGFNQEPEKETDNKDSTGTAAEASPGAKSADSATTA